MFIALILVFVSVLVFFGQTTLRPPDSLVQTQKTIPSEVSTKILPHLSLGEIFASDHSWVATLAAEKTLTLIATGDVIPARMTNFKTMVQYKDPKWTFAKTAEFLRSGDITLIDLEAPLLADCPVRKEGMIFCGHSDFVSGLTFAGVDVASLANNHTGNFGERGLASTDQTLRSAGIIPFGIKNPKYLTAKGKTLAFLGYNDIPWSQPVPEEVDIARMEREIKEADKGADIIIVEFHWGTEYVTPPEERQRELGQLAIDFGADLIIGNHPHWIKPIEFYQGKLITYGHGNFIFDQEWSQKTKEGVVGKYTFYEGELVDVEYFPIEIVDFGQPYFLEGAKKLQILTEMLKASQEI